MAAIKGNPQGPIRAERFVGSTGPIDRVAERIAIQVSAARGKPYEQVREDVDLGQTFEVTEAKNAELSGNETKALNMAQINQMEPAEAAQYLLNTTESAKAVMEDPDYKLGVQTGVLDPLTPPEAIRSRGRLMRLHDNIVTEAGGQGILNLTGDFAETVTLDYIFGGAVRDLSRSDEDWSQEIYRNSLLMSNAEWEVYWPTVQQHAKDRGVLGENYFNEMEVADLVLMRGFDEWGDINRGLAIIDTAVAGAGIVRRAAVRATRNSTQPVARVTAEAGPEKGAELLENATKTGADKTTQVMDDVVPDHLNPNRAPNDVTPAATTTEEILRAQRDAPSAMAEAIRRSAADASGVTVREVTQLAGERSANVARAINRPVQTVKVYGPGMRAPSSTVNPDAAVTDYTLVAQFPSQAGTPYAKRSGADKLAKKLRENNITATVERFDPLDGSKGFVVQVQERLDTSRIFDDLEVEEALDSLPRRIFGPLMSGRSTSAEVVQRAALVGENVGKVLRAAAKSTQEEIKKLKGSQEARVNALLDDLHVNDANGNAPWWSASEFSDAYFTKHKKLPTEQEVKAYLSIVDNNNTSWALKATALSDDLNASGYKSVDLGDEWVPSKPTNRALTRDDRVLDATTGEIVNDATKIDRTKYTVYEMWLPRPDPNGGINEFVQLVYKPKSRGVTDVAPAHSLPYRAGGPRYYSGENKFFLVFDDLQATITAPSRKLGVRMQKQVNEILQTARSKGIRDWDEAAGNAELDALVARNSDWLDDVDDWAGLVQFAKRKKWSFPQKVGLKADNEAIEGTTGDFWQSQTFGNYVDTVSSRAKEKLPTYGGQDAATYSPIQSINKQLESGITQYAYRGSTQRQMASWLAAAGRKPEKGESIERAFMAAQVSGYSANPKTAFLAQQWRTIASRTGHQGPLTTSIQMMWQGVINSVLDMGGAGWARGVSSVSDKITQDAFLRVGFLSAFVFNPAQFVVQASWVPGIMAISPRAGLKGASVVLAMRAALHAPDEATALLRLKNAKMAKMIGVKPEDLEAVYQFIKRAGATHIDAEALEKGTDAALGMGSAGRGAFADAKRGVHKAGRKAEEIGMVPFNEGERMNRLTAYATAAFEELDKGVKAADMLADDGYRNLLVRADDLSANMTTVSRGEWQRGLLRVPTQWLSFSMRMLEFLTFGKQLKAAEKARLWGYFGLAGGLTGFGLDGYMKDIPVEPGTSGYIALKYGMVDAVLSEALGAATGEEVWTGLGPRLSPMPAVLETVDKLLTGGFREVVFGPSGEIGGGGALAVAGMVHMMVTGDKTMALEHLERAVRTPSFIDNPWKGYGMLMGGAYQSKTGTETPLDFSNPEKVMVLLGLGSGRVNEWYDIKDNERKRRLHKSEVTAQAAKYQERWRQAVTDGDMDKAKSIIMDLNSFLEFGTNLNEKDIYDVRKNSLMNLDKQDMSFFDMMKSALNGDRDYEYKQLGAL